MYVEKSYTKFIGFLFPLRRQIVLAEGPSGPNRDYLFQLEKALLQFGNFFFCAFELIIK